MPIKGCLERVAQDLLSPEKRLNPKLFDDNDVMLEDVRKSLLEFAQMYIDAVYGKFENTVIKEISLVGSQASYFYHDKSDIDLVIDILGEDNKYLTSDYKRYFHKYLANIVSDQPLDNIFTRDITFILEAVLFISAAYLVICVLETKYKIRKIRDSYNALKNNYTSILTPDDLNMAFGNDKIMKEMSAEVNKGIRRYACLWGVFILISLIAIELISVDPVIWSLFQRLF